MGLTEELFLNEIPTPEQVASFSLILEEVAIALRCIRPTLPLCTPTSIFCVKVWVVLDPLSPIPEGKRKGDGLFNELDLRQSHGMLRNGKLPIHILKPIGQRDLSSCDALAKQTEFLDEALCRLFAELDEFDK